MSILILSTALSLVPIHADDARLSHMRTFVSPAAEQVLTEDGGTAFCLDRKRSERVRHVCLTNQEWQDSIALAEEQSTANRRVNSGSFPRYFYSDTLDRGLSIHSGFAQRRYR